MILWKCCGASGLNKVYQRISFLSSINQISKIPQRCHIAIKNEVVLGDKKKLKKFTLLDSVPKDSQLIYTCSISRLVVWAYNSSYFLTIFILAGIYYFAEEELDYPLYEPNQADDGTLDKITIYSEIEHILIYAFLLCYNAFGFLCCRRTPLRIWHNRNNNTYYMISPKLVSKVGKQISFKPGEMTPKYGYGSLPLIRNIHVMKGWKYYVNEENFVTPSEYSKFIGKFT